LISGKRIFSESEAVSTEESVKELKETDESESTACAGAKMVRTRIDRVKCYNAYFKHIYQIHQGN